MNSEKKYLKKDIVFLSVLFIIIIISSITVFLYFKNMKPGKNVCVYVDGQLTKTFPLNSNCAYDIITDDGINKLVIEDNKAFIKSADCPDLTCVNHKSINKSGEEIICIPHRLVIAIK